MDETVGIIGLGMIAKLHVQALEQIGGVEVIGGTDIDTSRTLSYMGRQLPVYTNIDDLLDRSPSVVIVATPTPTHYDIYRKLVAHDKRPSRVLIEKPLGSSLEQVEKILGPAGGRDVIGVYHAAHAPEVLWAMENARSWQETYGSFSGYEATFADPYRDRGSAHGQVYVNSWLDSGINALSVGYRFLQLTAVDQLTILDEQGSTFAASTRFLSGGGEGVGVIRTSWDASVPTKQSILYLGEEVHLYLDHQNVSGALWHGSRILEEFKYTGNIPRLQLHYQNAFRSIFIDDSGYYATDESRLLHVLLFERAPERSGGEVVH
jgi:hypothetical protein